MVSHSSHLAFCQNLTKATLTTYRHDCCDQTTVRRRKKIASYPIPDTMPPETQVRGTARNANGQASIAPRQQEAHRNRKSRVESVMKAMKDAGFQSPREFLREYFSNPELSHTQNRFYAQGGFEEICALLLNDPRGGRQHTLPLFLRAWIIDIVDIEFSRTLDARHSQVLRTPASSTSIAIERNLDLDRLQRYYEQTSPLVWGICLTLSDKSTSEGPRMDRSLQLPALTALSTLAISRNRKINAFATALALFLRAEGCPTEVSDILTPFGLTVSSKQTARIQDIVVADAKASSPAYVSEHAVGIVLDNHNHYICGSSGEQGHWRMPHQLNSTAGFSFDLRGVPESMGNMIPSSWWRAHTRTELSAADMMPRSEALVYQQSITRHHIIKLIEPYLPAVKTERPTQCPISMCSSVKPTIRTFSLMPFANNTIEGNIRSLQHIVEKEWGKSNRDLADSLVFCVGDQLTVAKQRAAQQMRQTHVPAERLDWNLRVLGGFHLLMNASKVYLHNHKGTAGDTAGLAYCNTILGKRCVEPSDIANNFYGILQFIREAVTGTILSYLMDYFGVESVNCLEQKALELTLAGDPSWCQAIRRLEIAVNDLNRSSLQSTTSEAEAGSSGNLDPGGTDPRQVRPSDRTGALLMIRDGILLLDYYEAMRQGDAGRIVYIIEIMLLQFVGARMPNYAIELMDFKAMFLKEFNPDLKNLYLANLLVQNGRQMAFWDEIVEEFMGYLKKQNHYRGTSGMTDRFREVVPRSWLLFRSIRQYMRAVTEKTPGKGKHKSFEARVEVGTLAAKLTSEDIWKRESGSGQGRQTRDLVATGIERLQTTEVWHQFLSKTVPLRKRIELGLVLPMDVSEPVDELSLAEEDARGTIPAGEL
ncbi:hypothetical protein ABW21_db0209246 [Orbilia brochopaga]|nr:hypothetical protein ABW21_db0209246 [Drechslerella brochopaga]